MPIRFHCRHCRQLLGISAARRGAQVDCPNCGRTIQVPAGTGSKGAAQKNAEADAPGSENRTDDSLKSALMQLSELAASTRAELPEAPVTIGRNVVDEGDEDDQRATSARAVAAPPQRVDSDDSETRPVAVPVSETELPPVDCEKLSSEEAAAELASLEPTIIPADQAAPESDVLSPNPVTPWLTFLLGAAIATVVTGWAAGLFSPGDDRAATESEQGNRNRAADAAAVDPQVPGDSTESTELLSGTITTADRAGDSGSLVLLLPVPRTGTLQFSGRALRRNPDHPDHQVVEAGLRAVGAHMARCDQDGRFTLPIAANRSYECIIVSAHQARPDGLPAADDITAILRQYFDSVDHVVGTRAVRRIALPVDPSRPLTVQAEFSAP